MMRRQTITFGLLADHMPARVRRGSILVDRPMELAPQVGQSLTYGTLADLAIETSARLAAAGVRARSRVAIVKTNGIDIPVLALACQRIGAVPALISPAMRPAEASELIRTIGPELLITDRATLDAGALAGIDAGSLVPCLCVLDDEARRLPEPLVPAPAPVAPQFGDQHMLITHSSGTTGTPKLVVQSVDSFESTARVNRRLIRLMRLKGPIAVHMSLVHLRSLAGMAGLMHFGPPLLVLTRDDPHGAVELLTTFRPATIEAHPASFVDWEPYTATHPAAFERVRYFFTNFDAMHPRTIKTLLRASRRRMPMYMQAYGQSESGPITTRADSRLTVEHADGRCVGYPILGVTHARVRREGDGRVGPIEVRSKGLAVDYLGNRALYESKRHGAWWEMGDIGYRTRFGCLHLLDREVDAVEGVPSLLVIEDALMERLPGVRDAVLIPMQQGPPLPVVATYDGSQIPTDVWSASIADLPALGDPLFCSYDVIPRTATGKVQRLRTQEILQSGGSLGAS